MLSRILQVIVSCRHLEVNIHITFYNILFYYILVFSNYYTDSPTAKTKEVLTKTIRIMNDNPEMFKKHDLESVVKTLSDAKFYQIKGEISKNLNFFKKSPKSKIISSIGWEGKDLVNKKFGVNVDIENNLIVLTDKFNENRHIIFVELGHNGLSSINLYQSLIKNMNPSTILIDQEPYQMVTQEVNKGVINSEVTSFDKFDDFNFFKSFLKEHEIKGLGLNLQIKNANVFSDNIPSEVESLIYHSLVNTQISHSKKKAVLFDLPYSTFIKSFIHYSMEMKINNSSLNEIKNKISVVNLLEIIHWLTVQEALGCKNCASFFNRSEVNWSPLHLEFLIDKNSLPNAPFIRHFKNKKISDCITNTNKTDSVMIFGSNILDLAENFINYSHTAEEKEKDFQYDFDDCFQNSDLNNENLELISLGLHLKEKYKNFLINPPLKMKNIDEKNLKILRTNYINDFQELYGVSKEKIEEVMANKETIPDGISESNSIGKKKSLSLRNRKELSNKSCEPESFLNSLLKSKIEMEKI